MDNNFLFYGTIPVVTTATTHLPLNAGTSNVFWDPPKITVEPLKPLAPPTKAEKTNSLLSALGFATAHAKALGEEKLTPGRRAALGIVIATLNRLQEIVSDL